MYARTVRMELKPNCVGEFTNLLEKDVIPMLRKQHGFKDEIAFVPTDGKEAIAISLWEEKENADAYNRATYPEVLKTHQLDHPQGCCSRRSLERTGIRWGRTGRPHPGRDRASIDRVALTRALMPHAGTNDPVRQPPAARAGSPGATPGPGPRHDGQGRILRAPATIAVGKSRLATAARRVLPTRLRDRESSEAVLTEAPVAATLRTAPAQSNRGHSWPCCWNWPSLGLLTHG